MRIFLSYGHDDNEPLVRCIKRDLEARGHDVWFDKENIKTGDDWRRAITDGILGSDWVLSFLSRHSTRDPGVCLDELGIALGAKGGIVQTVLVESEKEISPPVSIGHIQWLDMHDWQAREESDAQTYEAWYQTKLAEIVRVVESDTNQRFAGEIQVLQEKLKPISSEARIGGLLKQGFFGRAWLVQEIEAWRTGNRDSRVFWITGEPGIGKSALSAWLAHHGKASLIAAQFVEYNQPDKKDPRRVIRSIAFQIATRLPDYRKFLLGLPELDELDRKNATELFDYLLANPLRYGIKGGRDRYLVLLDALDEAAEGNDNELVTLLAEQAQNLPDWIGFIVTSRPEPKILRALSHLAPSELKADDPRNAEDLRGFLLAWFDRKGRLAEADVRIPQILEAAKGNFLYLRQFCDGVEKGWVDLIKPSAYPKGMTGLYGAFFKRQFPDIESYKKSQRPLLELVVASSQPCPEELATRILGWDDYGKDDVLEALGSLIPVTAGTVSLFHKSLRDWLQDRDKAGPFRVSLEYGQRKLGEALWQDFLENGVQLGTLSDYSIKELPQQLLAWRDDTLMSLVNATASWEGIYAALNRFADQMNKNSRWHEAEHWQRLIVRFDALNFGSEHLKTASSMNNLAVVLSDLGKFEEAEQFYRNSFLIRERELGLDDTETLAVFSNLTDLRMKVGKPDEAERDARRVLGGLGDAGNKSSVGYGRVLAQLGHALLQQGKSSEAEEHFDEAIDVLRTGDQKWGGFLSGAIFGLFMSVRQQESQCMAAADAHADWEEKFKFAVDYLSAIFKARYFASQIPGYGEPPFPDSIKASTSNDLAMTMLIRGLIESKDGENSSFDEAEHYVSKAVDLWGETENLAMLARSMWVRGYLLGLANEKEAAYAALNAAQDVLMKTRGTLHPESQLVISILHALRSLKINELLDKPIQDKVMLYGWETQDVSLTSAIQPRPRRLVD